MLHRHSIPLPEDALGASVEGVSTHGYNTAWFTDCYLTVYLTFAANDTLSAFSTSTQCQSA